MRQLLTGGEAIVRALEQHGVEVVFGIPGEHTLPIYRALGQSRIRHVTARHEQGAGFMADGYARAGDRPGVCIVVTGPGVTNVATPLAQAYVDSVPLLVLSGQIRSEWLGRGGGHFHEVKNQLGLTRSLVGHAERVRTTAAIPAAMQRAMAALCSGVRPRGAHLEFPQEVLLGSAEFELPQSHPFVAPEPDPSAIAEAASLLAHAERPLLIAGGGSRASSKLVLRLAERLDAPVLTTIAATGSLPWTHPLVVGGGLEFDAARGLLQASDAVLVVGSELGQTDFGSDFPTLTGGVIQVDIDPAVLGRAHPLNVGIVGDAGLAMTALLMALPAPGDPKSGAARAAASRAALDDEVGVYAAPYRTVVEALGSALPPCSIVALDLTGPTYWAAPRFLSAAYPHQRLLSGIGTLGYALPGAIGAKLAQPDSQVVAIVGDGGFTFTSQELLTASELGLSIFMLVWNNAGYGDIRQQMIASGARPVGVDLRGPDVIALARACGAYATRLEQGEDLSELVRAAGRRPGPTVVEVQQR